MRRLSILAAIAAVAMWCGTASAGEKIKLPTGKSTAQITTAVQQGTAPITNVNWATRAWRRGYYGGYSPYYYSYRPYYGYGYGYPYGSYYTRPYYGYSYYSPRYYGWGPGFRAGFGPLAFGGWGGWYW
ncbi:MAG TPA: hypothetical protein VNH11_09300 [Pirellulales bacterium]|nr:hypothetical protein [Pirellulales bacterium]